MIKISLSVSLLFLLGSCTKEHLTTRPYPRVETHAVTNITATGAMLNGEIIYTPTKISDHGFLRSLNETPGFDNSDTISLGALSVKGEFSSTVTRNLILGQKYYVRAFAKSDNYLVYGEIVSFMSLGSDAPFTIEGVAPTQHLMPGDTITVTGKNFGDNFQVKISSQIVSPGRIFGITDSQFKFQLPDMVNKVNSLSVVRFGQEVVSNQQLSVILSFKNNGGHFDNLYSNSSNCVIANKDYFGFGYEETNFMYSYDPNSNALVNLNQQSISPRFSPVAFSINGLGYFGGGSIYQPISFYEDYYSYTDFYSINPSTNFITKLNDLPIPGGTGGINHAIAAFTINNKGYCLIYRLSPSEKNELYEFDPSSDQWTQKADFPGAVRRVANYPTFSGPFSFVLDGIAYFGGGGRISDLWSYNPAMNVWTQSNLNLTLDRFYCTVSVNSKVYLVNSAPGISVGDPFNTRFYEFLPSSKTFAISPFSTGIEFYLNGSFSLENSGFLYSGSSIWEFDPSM